MSKFQIYGVGAALVDTEMPVSDIFLQDNAVTKGVMTLVDENRQLELLKACASQGYPAIRKSGGSACNTVVAASCFGASTFFSGKVATDDDGEHFVHDLRTSGVTFNAMGAESGITGKCLVMVTPDAERTMSTYLGVSEKLTSVDIDDAALVDSEWLYIEGYLVTDDSRAILIKDLVARAKQIGVKVALSLSDPFVAKMFSDNLRSVIGDYVDLIFCNEEEACSYCGTEDLDQACEMLKQTAKSFVVTRGAEGVLVFDGADLSAVSAVPVRAIDTNGAGDMFAGAFLFAICAGYDFVWAAELGNEAAGRVVCQFGPRLEPAVFHEIKQKFDILATSDT